VYVWSRAQTTGTATIHFAGGLTMVVGFRGMAAEGMPSNATAYDGPIDFIGSIEEIAARISRRVSEPTADLVGADDR
jgi:two-component system chemotaxis response regulator CheB